MQVSLLIPAKNSTHALEATVTEAHRFLSLHYPQAFEIILIPTQAEGEESSIELSRELSKRFDRVSVCIHTGPIGKGAAIQTGFGVSSGRWIFFTDADLPYDLDFFTQAALKLGDGYHLVTGNRRLPDSHFQIPVSLLPLAYGRHRLGLLFNFFVRMILPIRTKDTQAGIKAMTRILAEKLFRVQTCHGFFFDLEIFLTAHGHSYREAEIPVTLYLKSEKSTVRLFRESALAVYWLGRISWQYLRKRYAFSLTFCEGSFFTRSFLKLRWKKTPYMKIASYLPTEGQILDLGCGHGLLSLTMAIDSPHRKILGIDHDENRIAFAKNQSKNLPHLQFQTGDFSCLENLKPIYVGITLIDVLHYFSYPEQARILQLTFQALHKGGVLLFRDVDQNGGLNFKLNRLHEKLMTGLKITKAGNLYFRTEPEWKNLAEKTGFLVKTQSQRSFPFADVLYICYRK